MWRLIDDKVMVFVDVSGNNSQEREHSKTELIFSRV
jgi:hypothetical protein